MVLDWLRRVLGGRLAPPLGWWGWPITWLCDVDDYHGRNHPWYRGHLIAHFFPAIGVYWVGWMLLRGHVWPLPLLHALLWEGHQEHTPSPGQPLWMHVYDVLIAVAGIAVAALVFR